MILPGRRIEELRGLRRLVSGQELQDATGQRGIEPQHLQRDDDGVAAEGGREPRDAGIGVGAGVELGRQQSDVGPRLAEPFAEQSTVRLDRGSRVAQVSRLRLRADRGLAEAIARGERRIVHADLHEEVDRLARREDQVDVHARFPRCGRGFTERLITDRRTTLSRPT